MNSYQMGLFNIKIAYKQHEFLMKFSLIEGLSLKIELLEYDHSYFQLTVMVTSCNFVEMIRDSDLSPWKSAVDNSMSWLRNYSSLKEEKPWIIFACPNGNYNLSTFEEIEKKLWEIFFTWRKEYTYPPIVKSK